MQKIIVKNFKGIQNAEIEIRDMVVLIGEQATGKSTLAKLVYLFKSLGDEYLDFISNNLGTGFDWKQEFQRSLWAEISRNFYRFFGSIQHLQDFKIEYIYSLEKNHQVSLYPENRPDGRKNLKIDLSYPLYQKMMQGEILTIIQELEQLSSGQQNRFEKKAYQDATKRLEQFVIDSLANYLLPVFIPAGRNMAVTYADFFQQTFYGSLTSNLQRLTDDNKINNKFVQDTYLMTKFLERVNYINASFKELKSFAILTTEHLSRESHLSDRDVEQIQGKVEKILKGKYEMSDFGEKINLPDRQGYVSLNNASSGQQEVIRILQDIFLILLNGENTFRVVEEPEAHLFPTAQKHLIEMMTMLLNKTQSQVFLTTHSPYILSVINNLLFASMVEEQGECLEQNQGFFLRPAQTGVYRLKDGKSASIIDPETHLIDQNSLDEVSDELADEFDRLYDRFLRR
jgi:predicted ATP-dependent endonuclease of OLD family